MLINIADHLYDCIKDRLKCEKEYYKHTFYMTLSGVNQIGVSDLINISYTNLRRHKQKQLALAKIDLLFNLIIGSDPEINRKYDSTIYNGMRWAGVITPTYDIPLFNMVAKYFNGIVNITLSNDDSDIFMYIIDKLDKISLLQSNAKKMHFIRIINNAMKLFLDESFDRDIDKNIMRKFPKIITSYLRYVHTKSHVNPFLSIPIIYNYFAKDYSVDEHKPNLKLKQLLQFGHYEILYLIRLLYKRHEKLEVFNRYLVYCITTLLFNAQLSNEMCFGKTPAFKILNDYFKNLCHTEMSYTSFINAMSSYFGSYDVETFNMLKKDQPSRLIYTGSLSINEIQNNRNILHNLFGLINNLFTNINSFQIMQKNTWYSIFKKAIQSEPDNDDLNYDQTLDKLRKHLDLARLQITDIIKIYDKHLDHF
jgi:hypothetical protein